MSVSDILNNFINAPANQPYPIHQYAFISPIDNPFTKEVRAACEANLCGRYGKSWACPPGAGDWEELRDHYKNYKNALVYTTKHDLEDSFDIEGMDEGRIQHEKLDQTVLGLLENEKAFGSRKLLSLRKMHISRRALPLPPKSQAFHGSVRH